MIAVPFMLSSLIQMRRLVRPHFQSSRHRQQFYDVVTFVLGYLYLDYGILPFELMWIKESLLFWRSVYIRSCIVSCGIAIVNVQCITNVVIKL